MSVSSDDSTRTVRESTRQSLFPSTVGEWRELNRRYCSPLTRGRRAVSTYTSFKQSDGSSTQLCFKGGFDSVSECDNADDRQCHLTICPLLKDEETGLETVLVNTFWPSTVLPEDTPEADLVAAVEEMAQKYQSILGDSDACPEIRAALQAVIENPANPDGFLEAGICDEDDARQERCQAEWDEYKALNAVSSPHRAEGKA